MLIGDANGVRTCSGKRLLRNTDGPSSALVGKYAPLLGHEGLYRLGLTVAYLHHLLESLLRVALVE
jgi:hypothetical protein